MNNGSERYCAYHNPRDGSKLKILLAMGTRPEAIKMAPVISALNNNENIKLKVCITSQHQEMLSQVLRLFEILPDFDLSVMRPDQTLEEVTSKIIIGMSTVLSEYQPHRILVHGDTTTAFASSLAAYYKRIPVGHVEAGLRTGDIYSPWPEEINRKLIAGLADLHFAPTESARLNLLREGVPGHKIIITGNTVIDALLDIVTKIERDPRIRTSLDNQFSYFDRRKKLILVTGHRRESFGTGFREICTALLRLSERADVEIIYPVHLNPNVRKSVYGMLNGKRNIHLVEPLEYLPFVYLMSRAYLILTDSGGIQEEAPSLGKPVLVMRDKTERPEAVEAGTVKLVGANAQRIVSNVVQLLENSYEYERMRQNRNPYGDGSASIRILEGILDAHQI